MRFFIQPKIFFNALLIIGLIEINHAQAILIIPLPNLSMPAGFQKIVDAYEKSNETKAVALASEDKTFGSKQWVIGHFSGSVTQEEANQRAMNACDNSLRIAKDQRAGGQPLYNFGEKKCELHKFQNKTVSAVNNLPKLEGANQNSSDKNIKELPKNNIDVNLQNTASPVAKKIEKRIALIIGNDGYKFGKLDSPVNDARMISTVLKEFGFEIILLENASKQLMIDEVNRFVAELTKTGATGLFYFAGHGVQNKGKNYILPVDAKVRNADEIESTSYDIQSLLDKFKVANNGMNILILDACRDNPFSANEKTSGLAAVDGPPGTIVAFATAPGKVAIENNDNGIYTKRLLENIRIPGMQIESIFKKIRADVIADTNGSQVPWENTSLIKDFYFSGTEIGKGFKPSNLSNINEDFQRINKNNLYDWIAFYKKYKGSNYDDKVVIGINDIFAKLTVPAPPILTEELPNFLQEGYAGFDVGSINTYAAEFYGYPKKNALQVATVYKNSGAEKAGLLPGDILISINGIEIETMKDMYEINQKLVPGEYLEGFVWRGGKRITLRGVLERAPIETLIMRVAYENVTNKNFGRARLQLDYLSRINDPRGLYFNALLHSQGLGVEKNFKIAERDFSKSASQIPASAAHLAFLYMTPSSGITNDSQAFSLAKYAAEAGRADGAAALAISYFRGVGTSKNDSESVKWSRLSAEMGSSTGMFLLGARYEDGAGGLEKNIDLAKLWYRRSRDMNFAPAKNALSRLGE